MINSRASMIGISASIARIPVSDFSRPDDGQRLAQRFQSRYLLVLIALTINRLSERVYNAAKERLPTGTDAMRPVRELVALFDFRNRRP